MRAVSVIGVTAYHFQLPAFRGGFVGVDVFFVISGYLMTQIIAGRLDEGRFTFAEFYEARIRRIVPALATVVLCVTLAGYLLMDPLQLERLAADAIWSLLFASNFLYARQGGYFAVATDQNWLLHTWSLALEWQFYILYPILLVLLRRALPGRVATIAALLLIAGLSLLRMLAGGHAGPGHLITSFYMIDSRAWEFLVGGICAFAATDRVGAASWFRTALHGFGLVLVVGSLVVIESRTAIWPSALTSVPVAGAALMLVADVRDADWAKLKPVQALGRWSYSIYLWHWPVAAMCSFFGYWSLPIRIVAAIASIAIGFVSFEVVERRASAYLWRDRSRLLRLGVPVFGLAMALALVAVASNGLETFRFTFQPARLMALKDYRAAADDWMNSNECPTYVKASTGFDLCTFGRPTSQDTLVIGDSFAEQIMPRYRGGLPRDDFGITFLVRGGCVPISGFERIPFGSNCRKWVDDVYTYAETHDFRKVVFIAFWFAYDRQKICPVDAAGCGCKLDDTAFANTLDAGYRRMAREWRRLKDQGKEVVVVEEVPFGTGDPRDLYQHALHGTLVEALNIPLKDFEAGKAETDARLVGAVRAAGVTLVDPAPSLCPDGQCPFVEHGKALYKDAFHLRASILGDARFAVFDRYILPDNPPSTAAN